MASNRRILNVCLLALALFVAQSLLAVHDAAPHGVAHAGDCQLCAHAAGAGHALPAAVTVSYPAVSPGLISSTFTCHTASTRFHSHHARAPPIELA